MRAIAIDDEPPALKVLQNYCKQVEDLELVAVFTQPLEALNFLERESVDLVFVDIQMPGLSGLTLAKKLSSNTIIVFTTAFEEYALEGYNLNAVDYLLKPFSFARFNQALTKAKKLAGSAASEPKPDYIAVRSDYSLLRLNVSDIIYLEAMDDYIKFFMENASKPVVVRSTMKSIVEILPPVFIRVHRSFIVNKNKITGVKRATVLVRDTTIPIGKKFSEDVNELVKMLRGLD